MIARSTQMNTRLRGSRYAETLPCAVLTRRALKSLESDTRQERFTGTHNKKWASVGPELTSNINVSLIATDTGFGMPHYSTGRAAGKA